MAHIYIFSPSSAVRDKAAFRRGVKRLAALGHEVEVDEAALALHMRFAGDDVTRIAAIHRAAASGADVALISRGGYGLTRILPGIAYKKVAKAIEGGTQFVGLSDFTAFQLALLAKTGAISWAGPALGEDFGVEGEPDDIMEACFDDLVLDQGEGAGWRLPLERVPNTPEIVAKKDQETLGNGQLVTKNAVLWGGNLSVLVALLGTPYWPEVKGGVLFIEDVNEHPFRIERMLTQLLQAGVLASAESHRVRPVHRHPAGAARQGLQAGHRGRLAAQPAQGAGAHRLAVRPCADQGAAAGRRESGSAGGRTRRAGGVGASVGRVHHQPATGSIAH
jgi:muramoyltetrapeptide carboxypeptidase